MVEGLGTVYMPGQIFRDISSFSTESTLVQALIYMHIHDLTHIAFEVGNRRSTYPSPTGWGGTLSLLLITAVITVTT